MARMQILRQSASMGEDMGFECALAYLAQQLLIQLHRATALQHWQRSPRAAAASTATPTRDVRAPSPAAATQLEALHRHVQQTPLPLELAHQRREASLPAALLGLNPCPDMQPGTVRSLAQRVVADLQLLAEGHFMRGSSPGTGKRLPCMQLSQLHGAQHRGRLFQRQATREP